VRSKIKAVGRINMMFTTLREEREVLLKIKNLSADGKLPRGILLEGKSAIKNGKNSELTFSLEAVRGS
jgi:hypothetical protein